MTSASAGGLALCALRCDEGWQGKPEATGRKDDPCIGSFPTLPGLDWTRCCAVETRTSAHWRRITRTPTSATSPAPPASTCRGPTAATANRATRSGLRSRPAGVLLAAWWTGEGALKGLQPGLRQRGRVPDEDARLPPQVRPLPRRRRILQLLLQRARVPASGPQPMHSFAAPTNTLHGIGKRDSN